MSWVEDPFSCDRMTDKASSEILIRPEWIVGGLGSGGLSPIPLKMMNFARLSRSVALNDLNRLRAGGISLALSLIKSKPFH